MKQGCLSGLLLYTEHFMPKWSKLELALARVLCVKGIQNTTGIQEGIQNTEEFQNTTADRSGKVNNWISTKTDLEERISEEGFNENTDISEEEPSAHQR